MNSNNNYIEFKKERDLGAIISDTFKFIRENWKDFFSTLVKIAGPFIIGGAILVAIAFSYYMGVVGEFQGSIGSNDPNAIFSFMGPMFGWLALLFFIFMIVYIIVSLTSLYYIKSYINNGGAANFEEVKSNTFKNIWKFIGLGFLIAIMLAVSYILCFLPIIYMWVVLSLATSIMVFENKGIGDTISHCFVLIKEQWWNTFGVLIVITILVSILGYIFSVPSLIYQLIRTGIMPSDPTESLNLFKDPVYIALYILSYIGKFIFSSITLIATVFIYYDLNEQKNLTGTIEKIDSLGQ